MFATFRHVESGKPYTVPVSEVIVYTEDGKPCAITYEADGFVLHSNAGEGDFPDVVKKLRVGPLDV